MMLGINSYLSFVNIVCYTVIFYYANTHTHLILGDTVNLLIKNKKFSILKI